MLLNSTVNDFSTFSSGKCLLDGETAFVGCPDETGRGLLRWGPLPGRYRGYHPEPGWVVSGRITIRRGRKAGKIRL